MLLTGLKRMRRERSSYTTSVSTPINSRIKVYLCLSLSLQQLPTPWEWEVSIQTTTIMALLTLSLRRTATMPMQLTTKASTRREVTPEAATGSVLAVDRFQAPLRRKCFTEVSKISVMASTTSKLTRRLQSKYFFIHSKLKFILIFIATL